MSAVPPTAVASDTDKTDKASVVPPVSSSVGVASSSSSSTAVSGVASAGVVPSVAGVSGALHPLSVPWVLWYDQPPTGPARDKENAWEDNIKRLHSAHSIEEFWAYDP